MLKFQTLVTSLLCLVFHLSFSQNSQIYEAFDNAIGIENTVLFNGIENIDQEGSVNEKNKFLFPNSEGYSPGSITYMNQFFPDVHIKFNVVDDVILIEIPFKGKTSNFQLISNEISSFSINGKSFINIPDANGDADFYESILEKNSAIVFKKYKKSSRKKLDRNFTYFEYEFETPDYYLKMGKELFPINTKKEIIEIFPEQKELIRNFFKENKNLYRQQHDQFMKLIFEKLIPGKTRAK